MSDALRFVGVAAAKDLRRLWRDPLGLALCIAMPFVITVLVSVIFGGETVTPRGKLLIVDHDETTLSTLVRTAFGQGPLAKMVNIELVNADEGRSRIDRGDGAALLIIPKHFQDDVLHDRKCELSLITNPSQNILPGIIKESLALMAEAEFYAQALLGEQIRKMADKPPTDEQVAEMSVSIRRMIEKFERYLDPVVMKLETKVIEETQRSPTSMGAMFFPGMLFFGVLLVGQTLSGDLWQEKSAGTLRRTLTTSGRLWAFLAGKLLSVAGVLVAVALLGLMSARWLLHMDVHSPVLALAWVVAVGLLFYLFMLIANVVAQSATGANVLTSLVVFVFALAGGGMFPLEFMPPWLVQFGQWTPNGWASIEFKQLLAGSASPQSLMLSTLALIEVGIIAFVIVALQLRRFPLK